MASYSDDRPLPPARGASVREGKNGQGSEQTNWRQENRSGEKTCKFRMKVLCIALTNALFWNPFFFSFSPVASHMILVSGCYFDTNWRQENRWTRWMVVTVLGCTVERAGRVLLTTRTREFLRATLASLDTRRQSWAERKCRYLDAVHAKTRAVSKRRERKLSQDLVP